MILKAAVATFLLFLSSCASMPERVPSRSDLIGEFWMGDGLGVCEGMELRVDGTYKGTLCGGEHFGLGSSYREGQWRLEGKNLFFFDKKGQYKAPKAYYSYAEVFYYKGEPAFAKAEDLRRGKVYDWWVFEKRTAK